MSKSKWKLCFSHKTFDSYKENILEFTDITSYNQQIAIVAFQPLNPLKGIPHVRAFEFDER